MSNRASTKPILTLTPPLESGDWYEVFLTAAKGMSDEAVAAEFGGWLIGANKDAARITAGSDTPNEGYHQAARALLHLSEILEAEGPRPEIDVPGAYVYEYVGRLITSLTEVVGSDFIRERLDG